MHTYVDLCIAFSFICNVTCSDKILVDFILSLNDTGNFCLLMREGGMLSVIMEESYRYPSRIIIFGNVEALHRSALDKYRSKN